MGLGSNVGVYFRVLDPYLQWYCRDSRRFCLCAFVHPSAYHCFLQHLPLSQSPTADQSLPFKKVSISLTFLVIRNYLYLHHVSLGDRWPTQLHTRIHFDLPPTFDSTHTHTHANTFFLSRSFFYLSFTYSARQGEKEMYIPLVHLNIASVWISPFGVPGLFKSPNYNVTIRDLNFPWCLEDIRQFITSTLIFLFPRPPFRSSRRARPPRHCIYFSSSSSSMSSNGGRDGDDDSSSVDSRFNGDNVILALEL